MIQNTMALEAWTLAPVEEVDPAAEMDPSAYKRLACETLAQAVRDAKGRGERARAARCWLARDGLQWFEMAGIGIQPGAFQAWLQALPPLRPSRVWRQALISLCYAIVTRAAYG